MKLLKIYTENYTEHKEVQIVNYGAGMYHYTFKD